MPTRFHVIWFQPITLSSNFTVKMTTKWYKQHLLNALVPNSCFIHQLLTFQYSVQTYNHIISLDTQSKYLLIRCFRSVVGGPNSEPQFRWPWMPRLPRVCHMEPPQLGMGDTQTHHPMAVQSLFHCDRCPCVQIRWKIHRGQLWEYPF